jgi:hypothetical protein
MIVPLRLGASVRVFFRPVFPHDVGDGYHSLPIKSSGGRKREMCRLTALVSLLIVSACPVWAGSADADDPAEAGSPPSVPAERDLSDDDIQELERIRRRLGISPLQGPMWRDPPAARDSDAPSPFVDQLRKQYGNPSAAPPRDARAADTGRSTDRQSVQATIYRQRSLRSLSRRLDAIAQDMEDLRLYDEADRIRELSHGLREEARQ